MRPNKRSTLLFVLLCSCSGASKAPPPASSAALGTTAAQPGTKLSASEQSEVSQYQTTPRDVGKPAQSELQTGKLDAAADSAVVAATDMQRAEPSPFRQVLVGSEGSVSLHHGHVIYMDLKGVFDLTTRQLLASCQYPNGYLLSGKNLYFAARMNPYSVCPDDPFLLEYWGGKWTLRRFIDAHYIIITEWVSSTTVAAVVPYRPGPPFGYELVTVAGGMTPPRPRKGPTPPPEYEHGCYSELQSPTTLVAFPSGTLMVLGGSRCYLKKDEEDGSVSLEEDFLPAIESFPRGRSPSTIVSIPLAAVLFVASGEGDSLWVLGNEPKVGQETAETARVLLHFDGRTFTRHEAQVAAVSALVEGPMRTIWVLDDESLRPLAGSEDALRLPPHCAEPFAWFQGEHAWLSCDDGLYTTDQNQARIELPQTDSSCDDLSPRPTYSVPGLYKKASGTGGCRRKEFLFDGDWEQRQEKNHGMQRPNSKFDF